MSTSFPDPVIGLHFPVAADDSPSVSDLENEVMSLFDEFRDRLFRYVLSMGVSTQDGEEIIQEVFLSLFLHLQLRKSRANIRGWMFRVAHNLALKQRISIQRQRLSLESGEGIAEQQPDRAPNPEERMAIKERQERFRAVLRVLPGQDQCCLYLRAEGLRYREISGVLGMSLGAVSISLTRSLARLERAGQE